MRRFLSFLCFAAALALLGTVAAARPEVVTISTDEIRPGMRGYGLTVLRGTEPERFDVEVIDVLRRFRPDQDLILVRVEHPLLERARIVGGMSGSPIYLEGKLAGAYAYGWPFGTDPVGGVTPIANMLAEMRRPTRPDSFPGARPIPPSGAAAALSRPGGPLLFRDGRLPDAFAALASMRERTEASLHGPLGMVAAETPLMLGGVTDDVARMLETTLAPFGLVPVQAGGGGGGGNAAEARYVDGGSMAISLVSGDISLNAVGTVTHVGEGGRVLAFGHPMMDQGEIGLPSWTSRVLHVLVSSQRSFKIGEAVAPRGTLIHDRTSGIVIDQDLEPATIPLRIRLNAVPGARKTEWNVRIASHRALTPALAFATIANAIKATASDQTDVTYRARTRVTLEGIGPIELVDVGVMSQGPGNAAPLQQLRAFALFEAAYGNPFVESRVLDVDVELDLVFERSALTLLSASTQDGEVLPGEVVAIRVVLRRYEQEPEVRTIEVRIPERCAGQTIRVSLVPAPSVPREVGRARTLADLVAYVRGARPSTELAATIEMPGRGLVFPGHVARDLPASAIDALLAEHDTSPSNAFATHVESFHPMGAVITGTAGLELHVRARGRSRGAP